MTTDTTLDTYIKSPPPPKNPDAEYVYTEQQFSSLEKALRKHHDKILEVEDNAQALYENEVLARSTADEAIVQTIETLTASVAANDTNTQSQIQNIQTAFADSESSTANKLSTLEAKVDAGDAQNKALILDEAKVRTNTVESLASKVSNLEAGVKTLTSDTRALVRTEQKARADADIAEATARSSLQAFVGWDGSGYTKTLASSVTDEQTARVAADIALAQRSISTSAGTSRVYSQTTAPSSVGRLVGDIWIDTSVPSGSTSPNLVPYVWYNNTWNNNTNGNFSQYAGLNATVNQIATTIYDPVGNNASYEWIVKGSLGTNSQGQAAIRLTGAQKPNGTGGYTTTSKFIIDADTEINGSLLVNGTITGTKIATGNNGVANTNIVNNAVSNSAFARASNTPSGWVTVSINLRAGARVSILVTYDGGDGLGFNPSVGTLRSLVNGNSFSNNTATIRPAGAGIGVTQAIVNSVLVLTSAFQQYVSGSTTLLTYYTAPSDGAYTISADASSGFNSTVNLLVMELSK